MFGLMKFHKCGHGAPAQKDFDNYYCGTCKTIGQDYGQLSRMFLNYDAVFLAELMAALNTDFELKASHGIQARVCFNKPTAENLPENLEFAAATNIVLSELKIKDHIYDKNSSKLKLLNRVLRRKFNKAFAKLESLGIERSFFDDWMQIQWDRERKVEISLTNSMDFYAEPTARMTERIFHIAGEKSVPGTGKIVGDIGFIFGQIIYLIDAYQDFEKDQKEGQFNAFSRCHPNAINRDLLIDEIIDLQNGLISKIQHLPLSTKRKNQFISRLSMNIHAAINGKTSCRTNQKQKGIASKINFYSVAKINAAASFLLLFLMTGTKMFAGSLLVINTQLNQNLQSFNTYFLVGIVSVWAVLLGAGIFMLRKQSFCKKRKEKKARKEGKPDEQNGKSGRGFWWWLGMICGGFCGTICAIGCISCLTSDTDCNSNASCGDSCGDSCSDSCSDSCECSC